MKIAKNDTTRLHHRFEIIVHFDNKKNIEIASALSTLPGLIYASQTIERRYDFTIIERCLEMVFD